ncbi:MAG TPA: YbaK/EbsC family protein [Anaerolineaceae bacterium]
MATNNVIRLLQSRKIPFTAYDLPAIKLGALETARLLEVPPDIVYKTIVVIRDKAGKPILAIIPGPNEVDLKALAACAREKKVILPSEREAEQLTGLQAGGISPLALINKGFQVILDDSVRKHDQIHISGGQRGLNIRLPVAAIIQLTNAHLGHISDPVKSV